MFLKAIVLLYIFCFIINTEGYGIEDNKTEENKGRDGWPDYKYYPEIQGWLKFHREPADWQTARMNCHDEDAVLAAPLNNKFRSVLWNILATASKKTLWHRSSPTVMYVGGHVSYPEGIYVYKDGKPALSLDPIEVENLAECTVANETSLSLVDCRLRLPYVCHAPAASVCGDQWADPLTDSRYEVDERTGQCYKFHSQSQAWNDAHRTCLDEGAHLAIANSEVEAQVLVDLFAKYPFEKLNGTHPLWGVMAVGFYYWKQADTYMTIHGQTLEQAGYSSWSYGNPSSRGKSKELAGGMFRSGLLDDVDKSYKVPFICEKKPISLVVD